MAVVAALRRRRMSGFRIGLTLSLPISSVSLELRRLGLNKPPRLDPGPKAVCYGHEAPGDMIQLDIKKLGRIDGIGHRITGDRSKRRRGAGREYLHVCVDDHSRVAYSEVLPDERATGATGRPGRLQKGSSAGALNVIRGHAVKRPAFTPAVRRLGRHGVRVRRVITGNGGCYRSHLFKTAIKHIGARSVYTRPSRATHQRQG